MKRIKQLIHSAFLILVILLICQSPCRAQHTGEDSISASPLNKQRLVIVAGTHAAIWAGSYIALNKAWYADYPKAHFHIFNDNKEWNQMDKSGHIWTAYQLSSLSKEMWRWTGINEKTSIWLGGASAMAYQSIIEIQDGFSAEWGFSWGDMAANTLGAGSYVAQQLAWHEQRLQIKFSYWPYDYPSQLIPRRNDLFGSGPMERILKDYNAQTYWVSANLHSFWKESSIPKWLNVAVGYSSDLMLGGMENKWTDDDGIVHDYTFIPRVRRFYIAPDIDFTKNKNEKQNTERRVLCFECHKISCTHAGAELKGQAGISWNILLRRLSHVKDFAPVRTVIRAGKGAKLFIILLAVVVLLCTHIF